MLPQILVLLPLLGLYLATAVIASTPRFEGDESGYVGIASRMAGNADMSQQGLRLWWGPGYPLILVPFVALKVPWIAAKCLNAGFLFAAMIYFLALMRRYMAGTAALVVTLAFGLYPPFMRELHQLIAESLTVLLICGFLFHFCALYNGASRVRLHFIAASVFLAYLTLTKVFFGYVITAVLLLWLGLTLWKRTPAYRNAFLVFLLGLVGCVPYLFYTHSLTGRTFYWGTSGGMSLYWMSSPYPQELGSWFSAQEVQERPELAPHREFFAKLEGLTDVERDDAFKRQAIENIKRHPAIYAEHWAANVGRLLFSYPFSFTSERLSTYFFLAPNIFVVVLFSLSLFAAALRPRAVPFEMWALLIFAAVAFGGSTLLSAYDRQFWPLVPVLWGWMGFVYVRLLRIDFREDAARTTGPASDRPREMDTLVEDHRLTRATEILQ